MDILLISDIEQKYIWRELQRQQIVFHPTIAPDGVFNSRLISHSSAEKPFCLFLDRNILSSLLQFCQNGHLGNIEEAKRIGLLMTWAGLRNVEISAGLAVRERAYQLHSQADALLELQHFFDVFDQYPLQTWLQVATGQLVEIPQMAFSEKPACGISVDYSEAGEHYEMAVASLLHLVWLYRNNDILCDGDIVEEKNLVRQNFTPADLGENKAKVLAERYSSVFGMETEYVPEFIESGERLLSMLQARTFPTGPYWHSPTVKELVILIGAVDNNKSRKLCHEVFYKLDDLIYIDSGNGMHTGQIVCGIRSGGRTFYRPVGAAFPEVLQDTDKFPTELSCAEASVSAPQSIAANITAATAVVDMIYNILTVGETRVRQITFATGSVNMRATLQKSRKKAA